VNQPVVCNEFYQSPRSADGSLQSDTVGKREAYQWLYYDGYDRQASKDQNEIRKFINDNQFFNVNIYFGRIISIHKNFLLWYCDNYIYDEKKKPYIKKIVLADLDAMVISIKKEYLNNRSLLDLCYKNVAISHKLTYLMFRKKKHFMDLCRELSQYNLDTLQNKVHEISRRYENQKKQFDPIGGFEQFNQSNNYCNMHASTNLVNRSLYTMIPGITVFKNSVLDPVSLWYKQWGLNDDGTVCNSK
jgi:hypothetical protein